MEVGPILIGRNEFVVTRLDEVTQILAGRGRIVGEHSSLTGYELCETNGHTSRGVLIFNTITLGQRTGTDGFLTLSNNPLKHLLLTLSLLRQFIGLQQMVKNCRTVPQDGHHHVDVCTHDTSLGHTSFRDFAGIFRLCTITVLCGEIRDHKVSAVNSSDITVVALLQGSVGLVVCELIEYTESDVVGLVTTGRQDIVGRIVDDDLLRVINTFRACHVLNEAGVHIGKALFCIRIGGIVVQGTDCTLLSNIKFVFAGDQAQREHEQCWDYYLFHFVLH